MPLSIQAFIIRILIFTITLMFTSCGERFIPNKEVIYLNYESKGWLIDTLEYSQLTMIESNSNSEVFQLLYSGTAFNSTRRSSGIFRLQDREYIEYEVRQQDYISQLDNSFSIRLEAMEVPYRSLLEVSFKDQKFGYCFGLDRLITISAKVADREYMHKSINDPDIYSEVIKHPSLEIDNEKYENVLEFVLKDFKDHWTNTTIVSLILCKETGLIRYEQHDGKVFNRVMK